MRPDTDTLDDLEDDLEDGHAGDLDGDLEEVLDLDANPDRPVEEYVARAAPGPATSALSAFQRAANNYPPVTGEQQLELARAYREGQQARQLLTGSKLTPRKREQYQKAVARGEQAMSHLCASCWRLAWLIVREQADARFGRDRAAPLLDDLMAEANSALVQAVVQFDPERTPMFHTYAAQVIRNHVRAVLSRDGYMRMAPSWSRVKRMAITLTPELADRLGRHPTIPELQQALMSRCLDWADEHLTPEQRSLPEAERHEMRMRKLKKQGMLGAIRDVQEVLVASQTVSSLDQPLGEDGSTLGSMVRAPKEDQLLDAVELDEARTAIRQALATLSDRERDVILLRFGFVDGETWTYGRIAERYEVSAERIRQVERAALARLGSPHAAFAALASFLPSQDSG